jgi:hypothetical protein
LRCSSTFPSFLIEALPSIFLTQSNNCVSESTLQKSITPSDVGIRKVYFNPHIKAIQAQFEEVKELGEGPVGEWKKGLELERMRRVQDAARWEQWELKGNLEKVNARPGRRPAPITGVGQTTTSHAVSGKSVGTNGFHNSVTSPQSPFHPQDTFSPTSHSYSGMYYKFKTLNANHLAHLAEFSHQNFNVKSQSHSQTSYSRQGRSAQEVNEAKAGRRREIERRCKELDPPILPRVLARMETFQAALQISLPLTDAAWEVLKPRLLSQREEAEKEEAEAIAKSSAIRTESVDSLDFSNKDPRDLSETEWEAIQAPIREKLSRLADSHIRDRWVMGTAITQENAPFFVADLLLTVRSHYYNEPSHGKSAKNHQALPRSRLVLENMKWLYDNKAKSMAEHFQKDLFLCHGCEINSRFYGFEAVIQHYAAKHTTSLSAGNVVVNWRAEWPDTPPFHPNPTIHMAAFYQQGPWTQNAPLQNDVVSPHSVFNEYSQYHLTAHTEIPNVAANGYSPQVYPPAGQHAAPYHDPSQYGPNYHAYPQQADYYGQPGLYQGGPDYYPSQTPYPMVTAPPPHHAPSSGFVPPRPYGPSNQIPDTPVTSAGSGFPGAYPSSDLYKTQLGEMAKHAREVWNATSGIKDIPQSVRIFVVIQHVVFRFEQRYTNEPSISMFIDGLDHNALMRPVRSLNGLACKTCVHAASSMSEDAAQSQQLVSDRKLFTLPLLLNHFRSFHLEKLRPTVDLQTGMEASRLDWKRDMIELPDRPLIANLIHASGMDDRKLQLIAWVFPDIFPNPLPNLGSLKNPTTTSKHAYSQANHMDSRRSEVSTPANNHMSNIHASPRATSRSQVSRYSGHSPQSQDTADLTSDVPEHEYDPNRPGDLGRIVDQSSVQYFGRKSPLSGVRGTRRNVADAPQAVLDHSSSRAGRGAYGDQLLRHQDRSHRLNDHDPLDPSASLRYGSSYDARSGIPSPSTLSNVRNYRGYLADEAAADKFLDELTPAISHRNRTQEAEATRRSDRFTERPVSVSTMTLIGDDRALENASRNSPARHGNASRISNGFSNEYATYERDHSIDPKAQYVYSDPRPKNGRISPRNEMDPGIASRRAYEGNSNFSLDVPRGRQDVRSPYPREYRPRSRSPPPPSGHEIIQYEVASPYGAHHYEYPRESLWHSERGSREVVYHRYPEELPPRYSEPPKTDDMRGRRVEYVTVPERYWDPRVEPYVVAYPVAEREPSDMAHIDKEYRQDQLRGRGESYYFESRHPESRNGRPSEEYVRYREYQR